MEKIFYDKFTIFHSFEIEMKRGKNRQKLKSVIINETKKNHQGQRTKPSTNSQPISR